MPGESTSLRLPLGLEQSTSGSVAIDGVLYKDPYAAAAYGRRHHVSLPIPPLTISATPVPTPFPDLVPETRTRNGQ